MVGEPLPAGAREVGPGSDEPARLPGKREPILAELSRRTATFGGLTLTTGDYLPPLNRLVGQELAVEAVEFGIAMQRARFNVIAFGPHGSGQPRSFWSSWSNAPRASQRPRIGATQQFR